MNIKRVGKATKLKKIVYLCASVLLGLLISIIFHSVLEMIYLNIALKQSWKIVFYGSCALHPLIKIIIIILGLWGGYLFGRYWWYKIYIERILDKYL